MSRQTHDAGLPAVTLAVLSLLACPLTAFGQPANGSVTDNASELSETDWDGVLPSLSGLWFVPESLRLRYPEAAAALDQPITYDRRFPLGAQQAIDRGFVLPEPYGIGLIGVNNVQLQSITDLEVALGRGSPPPPGTELRAIPFVTLENVISDTDSLQLKADLWVLPNINVFGTIGRVEGGVDLDVVVDPADVLPPPACSPPNTCDPVRASFTAGVDTYTATLGVTGVYGWDNWFTTGTLSGTASFGENTDTTVRTWTASGRLGRRWVYGRGNIAAPYLGASYFDLDQIVEGTTRLPDAFPNGDSLDVRYKVRTQNVDKWSGVVGVNLGFVNGLGVGLEYSRSENGERFLVSGTTRF